MSIKAYVGIMGSGKTYEVVSVVILNALRLGRRVITNIAGINYPAMVDLLVAEGVDPDKIGKVVQVPHERVTDAEFWLSEAGNEAIKAQGLDLDASMILPGDLVCLDEIWRFWDGFSSRDSEGKKRPDSVMNFMRMHRHFTHPVTGVACDLAIITQEIMDASRQVRSVIEETYRMEKLTAIGSTKRYRVDVCQRGQSRRVLRSLQRSYEDKYFALYTSHSGRKEGEAGPKEQNIDQRGNILAGALFKFVLPVGAIVAVFAVWTVYSFLHPEPVGQKVDKTFDASPATKVAGSSQAARPATPEVSDNWRVVGWITGQRMRVVLSDGQRQRIVEPPNWKLTGMMLETYLPSGEAVTPWTGGVQRGLIERAAAR
jgi:zona occludens toxin